MNVRIAEREQHDTGAHVSVVCSYGRNFWLAACVCGWQTVWGSERYAHLHAERHAGASR